MKKIITLLAIAPLFFSSILYASDENSGSVSTVIASDNQNDEPEASIFAKGYNLIANNREYLIGPLFDTIIGEIKCGFKCAVLAGAAGAINELAIFSGFASRRYASWGVAGAAIGYTFNPSVASGAVGAAFGVLLPTGALNHKEFVFPAVSTVAGGLAGGALRALSGAAVGALDEVAIYYNVTDKHYLALSTAGMAVNNVLTQSNSIVINVLGALFGLIATEYEKAIDVSVEGPVKTGKSLYETYNKFIPSDQLNSYLDENFIGLAGSQVMIQWLSLKVYGFEQDLVHQFEHLNNPREPAWENLKTQTVYFVILLVPYALTQIGSYYINDYYCNNFQSTVENEIRSKIFSNNFLRLAHDENATVSIDNLNYDVFKVTSAGSELITDAIATVLNGANSIRVVVLVYPKLALLSAAVTQIDQFAERYFASQKNFYNKKVTELYSETTSFVRQTSLNAETIVGRNGLNFTTEGLEQLHKSSREYQAKVKRYGELLNVCSSFFGWLSWIVNNYLVASGVQGKQIPFAQAHDVRLANSQLSEMLAWPARNAESTAAIELSLNRMAVLIGKIDMLPDNNDHVNRVVKEGNRLILENLEVKAGNKNLVSIKKLEFEMGHVYAMTGEVGCGKTTLLEQIAGVEKVGVIAKGNIYYPARGGKKPNIIMLSKQDYFPKNSSSLEVVLYPDEIPSDPVLKNKKKEEVRALLKEIDPDIFGSPDILETKNNQGSNVNKEGKNENNTELDLDTVKDWYTVLSESAKKELLIASAINKNPDILILDEPFEGLDPKSIETLEAVLKRHLPNSLIIVVDNRAHDNDYNFYDEVLGFSDKTIITHNRGLKYFKKLFT